MPIIFSGSGGTLSSAPASSKIAQVQSSAKQGAWVYRYYNGWIDTGLNCNITPTASNSTIQVRFHVYCSTNAGSGVVEARLQCNGSDIFNGNQADGTTDIIPSDPTSVGNATFNRVTGSMASGGDELCCISNSIIHSPNSTSNQSYKVIIRRPTGSGYQAYLYHGRSFSGAAQCPSHMTAMEIRA